MMRSGFPGNASGPTFFLPAGKTKNEAYTEEFLVRNGAAKYSEVVMTPTGYLTEEVFRYILPRMCKGLRQKLRDFGATLGVDAATCDKLIMGLTWDGCKIHNKIYEELIAMAKEYNMLALCEGRDSSEINQPFDQEVARDGKRRGALTLDQIRRSHITPVVDQWMLILVGLSMLRDCEQSRAWENSFISCNLHPTYRLPFEEWIQKDRVAHFVVAADKFEKEQIDEWELLPAEWKRTPKPLRDKWIGIIDEDGASWDANLLTKLRAADMPLSTWTNIFRIYAVTKRIAAKAALPSTPSPQTPSLPKTPDNKQLLQRLKDKSRMIYHQFNPNIKGLSPLQRLQHAITVRNRTLGPVKGVTISPYLDVEVSPFNQEMLALTPDDINMHRVLQESSCKHGKRRRVAKRCLTALGLVSGVAGFVNDDKAIKEMKLNLKFAASLEEVKRAEKKLKDDKARDKHDKQYQAARKKCKLTKKEKFFKSHASKLTRAQIQAVAFKDYNVVVSGNLGNMRAKLAGLLPEDAVDELPTPDYPTQDEVHTEVSDATEDDDDSVSIAMTIDKFENLTTGEGVQVHWVSEGKWYEGEVIETDETDQTFHIHYVTGEKLWHPFSDFKVRYAC